MKYILILLVFFSVLNLTLSQDHNDSLSTKIINELRIEEAFFGIKIFQQNSRISKDKLFDLFKNSDQPELMDEFNYGATGYQIGNVLAFAGGGILGWELGNFINDKDVNQKLLIAGSVTTVISFIVGYQGLNKMNKTLATYNHSNSNLDVSLHMGLTPHGLGFNLSF